MIKKTKNLNKENGERVMSEELRVKNKEFLTLHSSLLTLNS